MALLSIALLLVNLQGNQGGMMDPSRDFVVTDKAAILMTPPDFVCGPVVQSMSWSSDGKNLAVVRMAMDFSPKMFAELMTNAANPQKAADPFSPKVELLIWNAASRTTKKVFSLSARESSFGSMFWLVGSSSLVFQIKTMGAEGLNTVYIANPNGKADAAFTFPQDQDLEFEASPTKPIAGLVAYERDIMHKGGHLRYIGPNGLIGNEIQLPPMTAFFRWSNDGTKSYVQSVFNGQATQNTLVKGWYAINRQTGQFEKSAQPAEPEKPAAKPLVTLQTSVDVLKNEGGAAKAPIIVLRAGTEQKPSLGLVSSDGTAGELAPDQSAVAYISQGMAMVRSLVPVPLDLFAKARDAALQSALMSRAKQVGIGLLMLASDMDDNYPENKGWEDKVQPYIMNKQMTDGFNYTFAGGPISDPAKTQLGFISGAGGRAVVYADGHVVWVKD